jgi:hypothetical protein
MIEPIPRVSGWVGGGWHRKFDNVEVFQTLFNYSKARGRNEDRAGNKTGISFSSRSGRLVTGSGAASVPFKACVRWLLHLTNAAT